MSGSFSSISQVRKSAAGLGQGNKLRRVQITNDGVEEIWNAEVHAAFMEGNLPNLEPFTTF
jgi:hypothetical protein